MMLARRRLSRCVIVGEQAQQRVQPADRLSAQRHQVTLPIGQ